MDELDDSGMEKGPAEAERVHTPVEGVAGQGISGRGEVDPHLMAPSDDQAHPGEEEATELPQERELGLGGEKPAPVSLAGTLDRHHPSTVAGMGGNGPGHPIGTVPAADPEHEVGLANASRLAQIPQERMHLLGPGHEQEPRRPDVEPLDQPGLARRKTGLDRLGIVSHEPVGESALLIIAEGMRGHTGRLVDHEEMLVLVDDPDG
jgi:hypothetical protein